MCVVLPIVSQAGARGVNGELIESNHSNITSAMVVKKLEHKRKDWNRNTNTLKQHKRMYKSADASATTKVSYNRLLLAGVGGELTKWGFAGLKGKRNVLF